MSALLPSSRETGTLPVTVTILPATSLNNSILKGKPKLVDLAGVDPVSRSIYLQISSPRSLRISLALIRISRLNEGFVLDHAGKAAWAASTASMACCVDIEDAFQINLPVAGAITSNVCSLATSLPLIRRGTIWGASVRACALLALPFVDIVGSMWGRNSVRCQR